MSSAAIRRDPGKRRVDAVDPGVAKLGREGRAAIEREAQSRHAEVDPELGRQGNDQQDRSGLGGFGAGQGEDGDGAERKPRVVDRQQEPAGPHGARNHVGQTGDHESQRNREGHDRHGYREQDGNKGQLGRDGEAEGGVEPDPRGQHQHRQAERSGHDGKSRGGSRAQTPATATAKARPKPASVKRSRAGMRELTRRNLSASHSCSSKLGSIAIGIS